MSVNFIVGAWPGAKMIFLNQALHTKYGTVLLAFVFCPICHTYLTLRDKMQIYAETTVVLFLLCNIVSSSGSSQQKEIKRREKIGLSMIHGHKHFSKNMRCYDKEPTQICSCLYYHLIVT